MRTPQTLYVQSAHNFDFESIRNIKIDELGPACALSLSSVRLRLRLCCRQGAVRSTAARALCSRQRCLLRALV